MLSRLLIATMLSSVALLTLADNRPVKTRPGNSIGSGTGGLGLFSDNPRPRSNGGKRPAEKPPPSPKTPEVKPSPPQPPSPLKTPEVKSPPPQPLPDPQTPVHDNPGNASAAAEEDFFNSK